MPKRIVNLSVAFWLGALCLGGCGAQPDEKTEGKSPTEAAPKPAAKVAITFGKATRGRTTYPVVKTHPEEKIRALLNRQILTAFPDDTAGETDYDLEVNDQLLIVTRQVLSGASGEYLRSSHRSFHYDLGTGREYTAEDLVLDPTAFQTILGKLIREKIAADQLEPAALTALAEFPKHFSFRIRPAVLQIVLRGGAGDTTPDGDVPEKTLNVPWGELASSLRVTGDLWRAFGKTVLTRRQLEALAQQAVSGYVSNFTEAVNSRAFGKISPYLLRDDNPSSFYRTQEKLLKHYEKKNIRVQLNDFSVLALQDVVGGVRDCELRAFTTETFTIDNRGLRTTRFHWEYTLEFVPGENRFALTDIEKWNPGEAALQAEAKKTPAPPAAHADLKKKVIRLTFDDGPNRKVTPGILDALQKHQYKATFFMLSPNLKSNVQLLKRMNNEGHTLALHGATHDHKLLYRSGNDAAVVESMNTANDQLNALMGFRSWICRVPYGSARNLTPAQLRLLRSSGYRVWDWNLDSQDTHKRTSAALVSSHTIAELKRKKGEVIVLMHDNVFTLQALPEILEFIQQNRWDVEPISPDFVGRVFIERSI